MLVYETTYILRPDINESAQKGILEKLQGIIQAHEGNLLSTEDWGKRRLAYPIKKESRGYYVYLLYSGNNFLVAELERNLRISEYVLRFLSVTVEDEYDSATFKHRPTSNLAPTISIGVPTPIGVPVPTQVGGAL